MLALSFLGSSGSTGPSPSPSPAARGIGVREADHAGLVRGVSRSGRGKRLPLRTSNSAESRRLLDVDFGVEACAVGAASGVESVEDAIAGVEPVVARAPLEDRRSWCHPPMLDRVCALMDIGPAICTGGVRDVSMICSLTPPAERPLPQKRNGMPSECR